MLRSVLVLLMTLVLVSPLRAQTSTSGGLRGVITDEQSAVLPGALVTATGDTKVTSDLTDTEGRYHLSDLPPGTYKLDVTLSGFKTVRHAVIVRVNDTPLLNVVMQVGGVDERVEVVSEAPLLDTTRGGTAVNISGDVLRAVPLAERREWYGALALAPGVTTTESVNGERLFYVHGADSTAQVVQIDGADMTPSGLSTVRFIGLSTDAIDDMQVKTAGVDASAPLGLGGIINIATASGSDVVKGQATLFLQPRSWNASNTPGGTSAAVEQTQADISMGAPLKRGRVWTFGAYRYVDINTGINRSATQLAALRALVPGFTPFDNHNGAHFVFAKGTAALSAVHQLSGFYQRDVNPSRSADALTAEPRTRATGGIGMSVRLNSAWSDRFATRIGASYNDKGTSGRDAGDAEPQQAIFQGTRVSGSRLIGTSRLVNRGAPQTAWSEQHNSKVTLSLDTTSFVSTGLGTHEVQAGVYAQPRLGFKLLDFYPNSGFILEDAVLRQAGNFDAGVIPFHRLYYDAASLVRIDRQGQDFAVYAQDAWRPISRLTLNAGLRVDRITWTDQLFDVTSQTSTSVGPRFGVNYALTADGRNVVKGHWVRVHDQPTATAASAGSVTVGQRDLYDLDLNGTFETTLTTPATAAVTPGLTVDPDFHQPFIQEWGSGFEKQFRGGLTTGVSVLRRQFRDRPTLLETNGRYEGSVFAGYLDENFNETYLATNNVWNTPVYTSLELSLTKTTSTLQALASYARQWRHLDGTWQPHDPASFIQPGAFSNDRAIGSATGSTASPEEANSLNGYSMTQAETGSSQWQDHIVRLGAAWTGPWSLLLATNYTFQSGSWSGPILSDVSVPDPAFGPATVKLSNGRVVSNPLATTLRFAYPTRGEGQLTTPHLHIWNVRLGRRFWLRKLALDASVDLFNIINHDADSSFNLGANQSFAANFGTTTNRQAPRSAQFVLRASF